MNAKQIIHSMNKIKAYENKMRLRLFMVLAVLFAVTVTAECISNPSEKNIDSLIGTGISYAGMAVVGNVTQVSDKESTGNQIGYKVWLIDVHQIDPSVTFPKPNASREVGTIPMLPGEYWHYFEAVSDTLEDKSTGEKGEVTTAMTNLFSFIMGGNKDALLTFIEQHAGGSFIIVYYDVGEERYKILGNIYKPMVLQSFERKNDKEGKYIPFTFQNKAFLMPNIYVGNLTIENPVNVAADATTIAITSNGAYQLTDGTAAAATIDAVSGVAAADHGRTIDIIGSGGTYPSVISDNTTFILKDGADWTANAGSRISFKILDNNTLVEVAGSRIQTA